jgi:Phosphofructokinase.
MENFRIGIATCGGDCPGLNSVIRAVVKTAIHNYGYEVIGFKDGYLGLVYNRFMKLKLEDASGLLDKGGTILGTTNDFDPFHVLVDLDGEKQYRDMSDRVLDTLRMHEIQCLIVIGGTNTIEIADKLIKKGINIIAIPKTIDNDVPSTDVTIGFMTSVDTATQALDKLHSSAESHHRVMILEIMGSSSGWVSLQSGIAGGADIVLIPEIPYDVNLVARRVLERKNEGKGFSIIVVSDGSRPLGYKPKEDAEEENKFDDKQPFDGVGTRLAVELEKLTRLDVKVTVLGYLQRGGEPSPYDRILATRLGASAVDMIAEGRYNMMAAIRNDQLCPVKISDIAGRIKTVPLDGELIKIARSIGISFGD